MKEARGQNGVSHSAVLDGMVSHYQPCLLAWCFILGHAFWFGTSLSAMHVGVVPHYRPCLLCWCLTIGHACWCRPCLLVGFALQPTFYLSECRGKRNGYKSDATLTEVPLIQTCLQIRFQSQICLLVQTCMLGSFIQMCL